MVIRATGNGEKSNHTSGVGCGVVEVDEVLGHKIIRISRETVVTGYLWVYT